MGITVGKRASSVAIVLALFTLFAACGSQTTEDSASQGAPSKKSRCDASKGEHCDDDDDDDDDDHPKDAAHDAKKDVASDADATDAGDAADATDGSTCRSLVLVASRKYTPSKWNDGSATPSPTLKFAIPAKLDVTSGNAGNQWATLTFSKNSADGGADAGTAVTCRYRGGASTPHPTTPAQIALGLSYVFSSCSDGAPSGAVAEADAVTLHIENGDKLAGPTTVTVTLNEEAPCGPSTCTPQSCDDQNACNGVESCDSNGVCQPGTPPTVDDQNPCTTDSCNPQSGVSHAPVPNGTSCGAAPDACSGAFTCNGSAQCVQGPAPQVDDGNACTTDACNPITGVSHTPVNPDDGDACTVDACNPQTGVSHTAVSVDDGDACTVDSCNAVTGVSHTAVNLDDGNACTVDACNPVTGVSHAAVTVDDGDACTTDTCNPITGVSHAAVSVDDGDACTADSCNSQTGVSHTPVAVDDGNACTADSCNPITGVAHTPTPQGSFCGVAQDACSGAFACDGAGACVQAPPPTVDDGNDCTADACNPITGVSHTPVSQGTACGDNSDKCVGAFACNATAQCIQGPAPVLDDQNPCTADSCTPNVGVVHTPLAQGTACGDNSNLCVGALTCNGSAQCIQGPAPTVDDNNICTIDACNPQTGVSHTTISGCDPTPTEGEGVFEKRASLLGRVVDKNGNPITGATFQVRDLPADVLRNDVTLSTANDGSFRLRLTTFSDHEVVGVGAQHVSLRIDAPGRIRAFRDAWVRPGSAPNLGDIVLINRDPQVTVIGPAGGTATDSQGLMQVVIPPGAIAQNISVQITPFTARADVPAVLPDATITTYAFELEPDGTQFALPVTVRAKNYRNVPSSIAMPAGFYDAKNGAWEHVANATLNGQFWEYPTTHFSTGDINGANNYGDLVLRVSSGANGTTGATSCMGSTGGLSNGALRQSFVLPSTQVRGRAFGLTFNYDSGLAGDRVFNYGSSTTAGLGTVPQTSLRVATRGTRIESECVASGGGSGGGGGNSCVVGKCVLGGTPQPAGIRHDYPWMHSKNDQSLDADQTAAESGSFVTVPLDDDGNPIGPGVIDETTTMTLGGSGVAAAGSGSTKGGFGTPPLGATCFSVGNLEPGPAVAFETKTLVHHRHASPFGAGWGVSEVGRLFVASPGHVILVDGDGQEEDFRPRADRVEGFNFGNTSSLPIFARDPQTGDNLALTFSGGVLAKVNADLTAVTLLSGLALPGRPHDMAITYVNAQRVIVVAADTGLVKIDAGGTVTNLAPRIANGNIAYTQAHVAAKGDLVYYVSGDVSNPVLYRLRLTDQVPALAALTTLTNGDQALDPTFPLAQVQLAQPTGMAVGLDGSLFLAERARNAVYRIAPDGQGEIGPTSTVRRVLGRQGSTFVVPRGDRLPGQRLPLQAPLWVSTAPDGTIMVATAFGLVQLDPQTGDAQWLALNGNYANAPELVEKWTTNNGVGNILATSGRAILFSLATSILKAEAPTALASVFVPTRTLELSNGQYFLVDGMAGTKEVYDSAGRLLERRMRTNEPVLSVQYVDSTSARIASITDGAGGQWVFTYASGKLGSVTDPSGRVNQFSVDGFGDLKTLTTAQGPDQEAHQFAYSGHKMTSKTSPQGQVTSYVFNGNGNLIQSTKPTGEVSLLSGSLDAAPQKDANGSPLRVGSYTTPFGVTHTLTTNLLGMIDKDVWTADAVTYTRQTVYDPVLYEGAQDVRRNTLFLPSYHTLNGVQEDRYLKWDKRGRLLRIGITSNVVQDFAFLSYDGNDRLVRYDGPAANDITRWQYENATPEARLLSVFRPAFVNGIEQNTPAQETRWAYQGSDPYLPSAMTTHGVTYSYAYDGKGDLSSVTDGLLLGSTVYTRDTRGNATKVEVKDATSAVVTSSSFDFDGQDRMVASRDAQNNQTEYDYKWQNCGCSEGDRLTGVHTPDLPSGMRWSLDYDPTSGRLIKTTDPDGHATQLGYTGVTNRLASILDANGHGATMGYDQLGRLATASDALSRTFTRGYPVPTSGAWAGSSVLAGSPNGTPAPTDPSAALGDGQYQIGIGRYQDKGNPAQLSFYRDATFELSYGMTWDNAKRLTYRRDRAGTPVASGAAVPSGTGAFDDQTFSYDIRTAGSAVTRTDAQYGAFLETTTANYNDELDVTDRSGDRQRLPYVINEVFQRDAAGRVTQASRSVSTVLNEPSQLQGVPSKSSSPQAVTMPLQKYQHDANGRLKQWTDADGIHDVFYDGRGLLAKITVQGEGDYVFQYDAVGRNTLLTYPGGLERSQVFDHEGRLTERCYAHQNGPTRCYRASYDAVGNPTSLQDPEDTDTITYDDLDRLSGIQRGNVTQTFSYNALGALHDNGGNLLDDQRPKLAGGGNAPSAVPATYNNLPVTLDAGGRITLLNGVTLKYSRRGALIGATKVSGQTTLGEWYGHDPDGRRISRTVSSTTNNVTTFPDEEYFAWTGANVTGRVDKNGAVTQSFLFEGVDRPLRLRAGLLRYYYELDIAGNVRRLRRPDGTDAGGYRYAGFGGELSNNVAPAIDQPLRWKARWWSDHSRLYDVRARQWSPDIGSFTSIDEFAFHDPTATLWSWPNASPIRFSDPSGRDVDLLVGGPYGSHTYGHTAVRIYGPGYDAVFDFGRYHGARGDFGASGDGVLNMWYKSFADYISSEQSLGRDTWGYTFKSSPESDAYSLRYIQRLLNGKKFDPASGQARGLPGKYTVVLDKDYYALGNNCTTLSLDVASRSVSTGELTDSKYSQLRGLSLTEKVAAQAAGVPDQVFLPLDLKESLDAYAASHGIPTHAYPGTK